MYIYIYRLYTYIYTSDTSKVYTHIYIYTLVGGLEHFLFSIIYGIILPTDFHIFQSGGSTTNQS